YRRIAKAQCQCFARHDRQRRTGDVAGRRVTEVRKDPTQTNDCVAYFAPPTERFAHRPESFVFQVGFFIFS
ncbi:MAG: hypothetical protein RI963_2045, partial [Planctomycetota bacterium]